MEKYLKYIHGFYKYPDALKMHLLEIWHDETHSYSTNGFVLLRAPGKYGKSIKDGKFPNAHVFKYDELEKALDSDAITIIKTGYLEKCKSCSLKLKTTQYVGCQRCGGFGELECGECGQDYECPYCEGSGKVIGLWPTKKCPECFGSRVREKSMIKIDGKFFNAGMLKSLSIGLPNFRFYPQIQICKKGSGFKFGDNGTGAIMEMKE